MEIDIYNLQKENEEFKDLTYDQLMKICELCLDYYKKGLRDFEADAGLQDEIDDLNNQIEELEDQLDDASSEYNALDEAFNNLKDKYIELKNEKR